MFQRIVVPLDGSQLAEQAVGVAAQLARYCRAGIVLLRVIHAPVRIGARLDPTQLILEWAESRRLHALQYLEGIKTATSLSELEVDIDTTEGSPATAIVAATDLYDSDCIVMSSHGQSGPIRTLFGSVSRGVLHSSTRPVLVVHHQADHQDAGKNWRLRSIVVPVNGTRDDRRSLEPAILLGRAFSASMELMTIDSWPGEKIDDHHADTPDAQGMFSEIEQHPAGLGLLMEPEATRRVLTEAITQRANMPDGGSICIVIAMHPQGTPQRLMDDEAVKILHHLPCSTFIIPSTTPTPDLQ